MVIVNVGVFGYGDMNTFDWPVGSCLFGALIGGIWGFQKGDAWIRKTQAKAIKEREQAFLKSIDDKEP